MRLPFLSEEELPVIDQSLYPPLPQIPDSKLVQIYASPFKRAETEWILSAATNICHQLKRWAIIEMNELLQCLAQLGHQYWSTSPEKEIEALEKAGMLDIVHDNEEITHIIINPSFAESIEHSQLLFSTNS